MTPAVASGTRTHRRPALVLAGYLFVIAVLVLLMQRVRRLDRVMGFFVLGMAQAYL